MLVSIVTLFPEVFKPLFESSILAKAQKEKKLEVNLINLRDFGIGPHKQVDDRPYGGGVGMILRVDVIAKAMKSAFSLENKVVSEANALQHMTHDARTILLTPQGKTFNQQRAKKLAKEKHLALICGHYEGVDERVRKLVNEEISIGDYILSGGEVAAMVVLDAVVRLLPGVLEKEATQKESFSLYPLKSTRSKIATPALRDKLYPLLEPPQYTRPEEFKRMKVPKVLLSGNHKTIEEWRLKQALKKTKKERPDLLK